MVQDLTKKSAEERESERPQRYDVIATGSFLGVKEYRQAKASTPVGYKTIVNMYPLDFENKDIR